MYKKCSALSFLWYRPADASAEGFSIVKPAAGWKAHRPGQLFSFQGVAASKPRPFAP